MAERLIHKMIEKLQTLDMVDAPESTIDQSWQDLLPSVKRSNFFTFSVANLNIYYITFLSALVASCAGVYIYLNNNPAPSPKKEIQMKDTVRKSLEIKDTHRIQAVEPVHIPESVHQLPNLPSEKPNDTVSSNAKPIETSINPNPVTEEVPIIPPNTVDSVASPKVEESSTPKPTPTPKPKGFKGKFKVLKDTVEKIKK